MLQHPGMSNGALRELVLKLAEGAVHSSARDLSGSWHVSAELHGSVMLFTTACRNGYSGNQRRHNKRGLYDLHLVSLLLLDLQSHSRGTGALARDQEPTHVSTAFPPRLVRKCHWNSGCFATLRALRKTISAQPEQLCGNRRDFGAAADS